MSISSRALKVFMDSYLSYASGCNAPAFLLIDGVAKALEEYEKAKEPEFREHTIVGDAHSGGTGCCWEQPHDPSQNEISEENKRLLRRWLLRDQPGGE